MLLATLVPLLLHVTTSEKRPITKRYELRNNSSVTIYKLWLCFGGTWATFFSPPTSDSWWHRRRLSFWPIKLTHICQLPMYHLLSGLHQPVMNGPASSAQYDAGWLAVQHRDAWQELSEQNNSANVHHLVMFYSNYQHGKNNISVGDLSSNEAMRVKWKHLVWAGWEKRNTQIL